MASEQLYGLASLPDGSRRLEYTVTCGNPLTSRSIFLTTDVFSAIQAKLSSMCISRAKPASCIG